MRYDKSQVIRTQPVNSGGVKVLRTQTVAVRQAGLGSRTQPVNSGVVRVENTAC